MSPPASAACWTPPRAGPPDRGLTPEGGLTRLFDPGEHERPIGTLRRFRFEAEELMHGLDVEEVRRWLEPGKGAVAPPAPIGRIVAVSRTYWVEGDVSVRLEKMCIVRDVPRGEPSGEQMPAASVLPIEPLRVLANQTPHSDRKRRGHGVDDQVEVCSHQAVRLAAPVMVSDGATQLLHEPTTIRGFAEEQLIAARHRSDVMDRIRKVDAWFSRHIDTIRTSSRSDRRCCRVGTDRTAGVRPQGV